MKIYENPSSGSRVDPCHGRTDMTELIVDIRDFANARSTQPLSIKLLL